MNLQPLTTSRFVRRTQLAPNEYRRNFQQIDREILSVITSPEADQITPLMSKIYLRMVNAPPKYWESEGVLRIVAGQSDEKKIIKAWTVFCELVGVASATASKAVRWMHEQGIIGYFSGKNGVGLRIFLNRAASSIGLRQAPRGQKILALAPASREAIRASSTEPAFNDSFAVIDILDSDKDSPAPKNSAEPPEIDKTSTHPIPARLKRHLNDARDEKALAFLTSNASGIVVLDDVVRRLRAELEPAMHVAARQAAAREHEKTREWLETRGLPKAARVAQHEAYNVLRKYGLIRETARNPREHAADASGGRYVPPAPHQLSVDEIAELAGACIAMRETKGQAIELTLSEMSVAAGGFLLPEDVLKVSEKTKSLLAAAGNNAGNREGK